MLFLADVDVFEEKQGNLPQNYINETAEIVLYCSICPTEFSPQVSAIEDLKGEVQMKRSIRLIRSIFYLACLFSVSLFVGCGDAEEPEEPNDPIFNSTLPDVSDEHWLQLTQWLRLTDEDWKTLKDEDWEKRHVCLSY